MVDSSISPVILTIDDEAVIRASFRAFLEDYNYTVLEAPNGKVGVEIYEQEKVDLILVDLRMPEMDGREVLSAIRENNPDIPIIVISGTGNISDVVDALRLGATDYLLKPVEDMDILLHAVEKGIKQAQLVEENKRYQSGLEDLVGQKTRELEVVNNRLVEVVESTKGLLGCGELLQSGHDILQEFGKHMEATGGSVYRVSEWGLDWVSSLDEGHAVDFIPFPLDEKSVYGQAFATKSPFLIRDISSESSFISSGWGNYTNSSCIVFPVMRPTGDVRALISLHNKVNSPFTNQDREIGSILMSYSAEALETAQAMSSLKQSEEFLMQAQKMEAIGTLAGGIAHDFNNILSAIVGYTDLSLFSKDCDEKIKGNLEQVKKASDRAKDLVGQILSFSRTEPYQAKAMDLGPVIREVLKLLRATIPSSISIIKNIPIGLGRVVADPTRIHQIIMNLCTNAVHALGNKDGTITIDFSKVMSSMVAHDLNGISAPKCLKLSISDTGKGMSPEVTSRIFNPYFTTKEQGEGTGLGLAVVHGIVRASGGVICVDSEEGIGTTFHVYLPCTEESEETHDTGEMMPVARGHEKILFVDDEATLADMAKEMLQRLGYEVVTMTSSVDALEMIKADPDGFDLLITDQTMPVLSGLELAQKVLAVREKIPVILYTGYSATINGAEARRVGIKEFMMKPLSMTNLSHVVRKVLDEK